MATPNAQPIVETRGLTKVFKDFWMRPRVVAVDSLDLRIESHEVFGLLGPNGSGKSTAIKIILGLLFPTRGRVSVFGRRPTEVAVKSRIGYMPEESYLYRFLNARETLDFYGRLFHLDHRTRVKRIDMLLEMVGLDAVQRRPVGEYSKGMQRRIGLAQALINDPDLLILDEPTTGLDPIGTRQIKDLILELKRRGKTVLLSSHLLADVEDVCDRVAVMYGGKKRVEGTVDDLLEVRDSTMIQSDSLDAATLKRVEEVLRASGRAIHKVQTPRQTLDELFLDIVHRAQAEGATTHGARAGGRMAEFLVRDAHLPEDVDGTALIRQLVAPVAVEPVPASAAAVPEKVDTTARDLIRGLVEPEPVQAPPPLPEPGDTGRRDAAPPEADRGVIDELLGGDQR